MGIKAFYFENSTGSSETFSLKWEASSITALKAFFSLSCPNRGFQEFCDEDRAFIVRFPQDNTFVTLDYKSESIVGMDLVERLGVAKSDQMNIRTDRSFDTFF